MAVGFPFGWRGDGKNDMKGAYAWFIHPKKVLDELDVVKMRWNCWTQSFTLVLVWVIKGIIMIIVQWSWIFFFSWLNWFCDERNRQIGGWKTAFFQSFFLSKNALRGRSKIVTSLKINECLPEKGLFQKERRIVFQSQHFSGAFDVSFRGCCDPQAWHHLCGRFFPCDFRRPKFSATS